MSVSGRDHIFISYAHEDAAWKDEFEIMFAPVRDRGIIRVWSDEAIQAGGNWDEDIRGALKRAKVALLLVTDSFLKSEFISRVEMRELLKAARRGDVSILWVPVSASLWEHTDLKDFQACCNPERPLNKLPEAVKKEKVKEICDKIIEMYGTRPHVSEDRRENLLAQVQKQIGNKYQIADELAAGKFSLIYTARSSEPERTVAIKTFVASELDEWARRAFLKGVKRAVNLTSPAFIKVLDYFLYESPNCIVLEYVESQQLDELLARPEYKGGLSLAWVKSILLDLAKAIEEAHDRENRARGELCPSDILIEKSGMARLSALDFSNILRDQAQLSGYFLVDRESLAYMTPERFDGQTPTKLADQYSLGLIASELLGGRHIPLVRRPCDLEVKRDLFDKLQSGTSVWAERSPEFAGVVCRMLRTDPTARWPSMSVVRQLLEQIEIAESKEELQRKIANASYLRLQARGIQGEREFYAKFYDNLFAALPDVEEHFRKVDMKRQYQILNSAIHTLLDFRPDGQRVAREKLEHIVAQHEKYKLGLRHYEGFLESLLKTLQEFGEHDPEKIEAWRATLSPGIEFMTKSKNSEASHASK
jgi:serine/threonine protein kinase